MKKPMLKLTKALVTPPIGGKDRRMRRWVRVMKRIFKVVLLIDEKGSLCNEKDLEAVRDKMRSLIQQCPYPELRVMENVLSF